MQGLERDPGRRPPTVTAFAANVTAALAAAPSPRPGAPPMSRRRSPPRRPPGRGCSRRSSAQFAGKVHSSSCYCYYYHMAATSISRSEEHTSELQSQSNLVCRLLLEKKKKIT